MKRINLDHANPLVRKFLGSLSLGAEGVELEINGRLIGKLVPPFSLSEAQKDALIKQRWQLIRQAQKRNKGVPSRIIEQEIREAVEVVRRRKK